MTIRIPESALKEIASLRIKIAELEAELRRRDQIFDATVQCLRRYFRLTIGEARIVAVLADGNAHSREQLMEACDTDANSERTIDGHVKRIRAKKQLQLRTEYGLGYALAPGSLTLIQRALNGVNQ